MSELQRNAWLLRAVSPSIGVAQLERSSGDGVRMKGHFAIFNEWAEIHSAFEGHFMERIAKGAFSKTFKERGSRIRCLFQHGRDPYVGDKPLGSITRLAEEGRGAAYEVELLDTEYVRQLVPALDAGLYGASFRFRPLKVEINEDAKPSNYNPSGLPECTVTEASVSEFGPVTFPAYQGATAGLRSLTDEFAFTDLSHSNRLEELASFSEAVERLQTPARPRASARQPVELWGLASAAEDDLVQLPDWYHERQEQLRQQPPRYGLIEGG